MTSCTLPIGSWSRIPSFRISVSGGWKGPPSQNQQQRLRAATMKEMRGDGGYPLSHGSRPWTEREAQHHLGHWVGRREQAAGHNDGEEGGRRVGGGGRTPAAAAACGRRLQGRREEMRLDASRNASESDRKSGDTGKRSRGEGSGKINRQSGARRARERQAHLSVHNTVHWRRRSFPAVQHTIQRPKQFERRG
jgi:hypothetical protein